MLEIVLSELSMKNLSISRNFLNTDEGQIHYRKAGSGKKIVLLLHQTPRSSDEFRDVIPKLAEEMTVLAMDTVGYGDSYKPIKDYSIEDYANTVIEFLDSLGIPKVSVAGHHTGAVIAVELGATHGDRIEKLVLSACSYFDETTRASRKASPPIDEVEFKKDGSHLVELWNRRRTFYPQDRPDLLLRYVSDALKAGENVETGHRACRSYRMEDKITLIECPTLLVCGTEDPYAFPEQARLQQLLKRSKFVPIVGGMVPLPDQMPEEFARTILPFLLSEG
jgi:pimeloyl-ACP methyl ester carboxylesterase